MKSYKMAMRFSVDVGPKSINDILSDMAMEQVVIKNAAVLTITQTTAFIPDDKYIRTLESIIKQKYEINKDFNVVGCKFIGYEYFKEVQDPDGAVSSDHTAKENDTHA